MMQKFVAVMLGLTGLLTLSGCRAATRVAEVPRVDLSLEEGNRGYLVGKPPETPVELKTTRQIMQTDIEIPSFYKPKRTGGAAGPMDIVPPEMDVTEQAAQAPAQGVPEPYDTYVVKKGESLWSIAAKPEVYGKATRWRRIFDANREVLKSPDRLRPGMALKIPRGQGESSSASAQDEGTTFKK